MGRTTRGGKTTRKEFACKSIAKRKLILDDDVEDVRRKIETMHYLPIHLHRGGASFLSLQPSAICQTQVRRMGSVQVDNIDCLVANLCTIWIGRFHLHANVARSHRERKPSAPSHPSNANEKNSPGLYVSILKSGKTNNVMSDQILLSLILDDSCILDRDSSLSLMGKVKDITAMPNLYVILEKEGIQKLSLTYLGGLWVLIEEKLLNHTCVGSWFSSLKRACNSFVSDERLVWISLEGLPIKVLTRNTFAKVAFKWGDAWEDLAEKSLFCKSLCVKTKLNKIIVERFKVIVKVSHLMMKKMRKTNMSQSGDKVTTDNDVKRVSESSCMHNNDLIYDNNHNNIMPDKDKVLSEDPFNLYDILNKRKDSGNDLKYPPGFTPSVINVEEVNKKVKGATSNEVNEQVNFTSNELEESVPKEKFTSNNSVCSKRVHIGSSILQLMHELVKVGQTMV
ncbi:hypothetical protein Tco_0126504 [Tanacetum coccineum]